MLAVALVLAGASVAFWRLSRPAPVPVSVDPACPALLRGTSDALDDYADLVTWAGHRYVSAASDEDTPEVDEVTVGALLGRVTCSFVSMPNDQGWSVAPGAWPDGTATTLEKGTTLRAVVDLDPGRALVAQSVDGPRLYCLADPTTLEALC